MNFIPMQTKGKTLVVIEENDEIHLNIISN